MYRCNISHLILLFAVRYMKLYKAIRENDFILTQAAVNEFLRRSVEVTLHPRLGNALFIYDEVGKKALSEEFLIRIRAYSIYQFQVPDKSVLMTDLH